jgi:hypothetical protein
MVYSIGTQYFQEKNRASTESDLRKLFLYSLLGGPKKLNFSIRISIENNYSIFAKWKYSDVICLFPSNLIEIPRVIPGDSPIERTFQRFLSLGTD